MSHIVFVWQSSTVPKQFALGMSKTLNPGNRSKNWDPVWQTTGESRLLQSEERNSSFTLHN